jgi:glycosyltransferase involved in cell wall biosynthesis
VRGTEDQACSFQNAAANLLTEEPVRRIEGAGTRRVARPIRVLELAPGSTLFGAERWILALARNLDRSLCETVIAVIQDSPSDSLGLLDAAAKYGLTTRAIRVRGKFSPAAITKLATVIRTRAIDVVHTHGYKTDILGYLATRLAPAKLVCTPHGWSTHMDPKLRAYLYLNMKVLKRADAVMPLSETLRDDLRRIGVPERKNRLIANGVDLDEVREARKMPLSALGLEGNLVMGYIGQLIARKRLDSLVRAFAQFRCRFNRSSLVLVGTGDEEPSLRRLVRSLELEEAVKFTGFRDDRLSLLKSFDVLVLPSELEGIPRCVMEAMAAGVSVVASEIPGTTDLVKNGVTGLTFPVGDEQQLYEALVHLLQRPRLAIRMREAAASLIERDYSARRMADDYARFFHDLLRRPVLVTG